MALCVSQRARQTLRERIGWILGSYYPIECRSYLVKQPPYKKELHSNVPGDWMVTNPEGVLGRCLIVTTKFD